jgi:DNA-binding MarR family transcriptional regulator
MTTTRSSTVQQTRFDSLQQEAYLNLWRTYDRLKVIEDELFAKHDLSAQQYNALRLLETVHPGTMPTLALGQKLISRAPDMTRMLDRLEERSLVQRERRPENRRVVEVAIAPAGLELLEELSSQVREGHKRQLGHMTARELKQLIELLQAARNPHEEEGSRWHRKEKG